MATSAHAIQGVSPLQRGKTAKLTEAKAPAPRSTHGWAWRIGRIAGIDLYVHATFVLLLGWIALSHVLQGQGAAEALSGVGLIIAVFATVVLHELGHALVAQRFGIGTQDITLLPIGGVARLDRIPEEPVQELLVAIAGPAVNVALAALFFILAALLDGSIHAGGLQIVGGPFLSKLAYINVGLAVFNLLPAFPMDGGRVLRALLAMRLDYVRATDLAARLGQGFALLFGLLGVFFNPVLVFGALFVWMGAQQEAGLVHVRSSLQGMTVGHAMITDFRALSPDETVAHALAHALAGFQEDFPVVEDGSVVGVLRRADVLRAVASSETATKVRELMKRDLPVVSEALPLLRAAECFKEDDRHAIPVLSGGVLVGMLTQERIGEVILMRESAARSNAHRAAG